MRCSRGRGRLADVRLGLGIRRVCVPPVAGTSVEGPTRPRSKARPNLGRRPPEHRSKAPGASVKGPPASVKGPRALGRRPSVHRPKARGLSTAIGRRPPRIGRRPPRGLTEVARCASVKGPCARIHASPPAKRVGARSKALPWRSGQRVARTHGRHRSKAPGIGQRPGRRRPGGIGRRACGGTQGNPSRPHRGTPCVPPRSEDHRSEARPR
jgi:hypothetical protein